MSIKRKLASNTIYLLLDHFFLLILSFIFWWILGKSLEPYEYGIVSTSINTVILLSAIVLIGFPETNIKLIPEYQAKKQKGKINSLIKFSFKTLTISNIVCVLFLFISSSFLASLLEFDMSIIWVIILTLIIYSYSQLSLSLLSGFQKMKNIAIIRPFTNLAKVLSTVVLIYLGFSYFGPLIGFILQCFLIALIIFPINHLRGASKYIDRKNIMITYAIQAFFISFLWKSFNQTPYMILTALQGSATTGIFSVAMIITTQISLIPTISSGALFPIISQLSATKNAKKNQRYLTKLVFRYSIFIMLPITIFLIMFPKPIILLYSGPDYLEAFNLFPILALSSMIFGCGIILLNNLFAIGKPKIKRNILAVTSFLFLSLSVPFTILFSLFDIPGLGISLAYSLSIIILSFLSFYYIKKYLRFNIPLTDIKKLFIGGIISFIFLFFMSFFIENPFLVIILFAVSCLIYLTVLIPLRFYNRDDITFINFIEKKSPVFKKQIKLIKEFLSKFVDTSHRQTV